MAQAAGTLKHVTLELGGKSPLIVFADADLDNAVSGALLANFYTQGEVCSNGTRVFVHASIKARVPRPARRPHGEDDRRRSDRSRHPRRRADLAPSTWRKVLGYIERRPARGRRAALRRRAAGTTRRSADGLLRRADGLRPAARDDMTIVREEIFGPVMSVLTFDDEDEVVAPGQRHRVRPRGRRVHPRPPARPPRRRRARGGHVLDQQLQHHADRAALRRLQAVGHRPRERPRRDRALHPAEERLRRDGRCR